MILFIGLYIFAFIVVIIFHEEAGISLIEFTAFIGISILLFMTPILTKNMKITKIETKNNLKESFIFYFWWIFAIILYILIIRPIVTDLDISSIIIALYATIVIFLIPMIILVKNRKYSLNSLGISKDQLKKNIIASIITFSGILVSIFVIQLFVFANDFSYIITNLPLALIFNLFVAALPEEFLFRAVIQTRISNHFESKERGIIITSLLFGISHVFGIYINSGYRLESLLIVILRTITFQTLIGIVLGIMWARTNNLMLPVIAHMTWNCIYL